MNTDPSNNSSTEMKTSTVVPPPIHETLEWLISAEEFTTSRALIKSIAKMLPPNDPEASDYLASAYTRSKAYHDAVRQSMHTLNLVPDSLEATFNAAKCQGSAANPYEAEKLMTRVVMGRPQWVDPQIDLAVYIGAQGRVEEAKEMLEAILEQIPADNPNTDVVKFNLGWHFIRTGDFKKGMKLLGLGRKLRIWGARSSIYPRPVLTPEINVEGKTILLCGEGGAGDEMINVRFAQTIKQRGGRALWLPQPALASLLSRAKGVERVLTRQISLIGAYDYWAPAMDLPHILGLDLHEIPHDTYITPNDEYVKIWKDRFQSFDRTHGTNPRRLKVGLRWQGNALYEEDLKRSIPFKLLEQLTEFEGIDFYSLQRDEGSEELSPHSKVIDLGPLLKTWEDTAAAITHLDLVISSCTSVPHLSAALGKPTWVLSPLSSYYIWATPGESSPWYPSVTLFRQSKFNDWSTPLASVRERLQQFKKQYDDVPRREGASALLRTAHLSLET